MENLLKMKENSTGILIIVKSTPDLFCNRYQGMACSVFFYKSELIFVKAFVNFKK